MIDFSSFFTPLNRGKFFPLRFLRFSSQTQWSGFSDFFFGKRFFFSKIVGDLSQITFEDWNALPTKNPQKKTES
ncbi:hypothetical protein DLM75_21940 [Leptospira stimsonii]|uniref:Uncharacterized protein n=1 Tax=Leptospira stimsonii TaxID=2202203 RepID=A0A396YUY2_9LEPT|nr:hypothetical protein DLM75_21940 [Leptospira stimsonii]